MPSRSSDLVDDRRRRRDQVHVVLALEPLLHDVHVQEAEEAAAEAEAQRLRDFGLVVQRRVVELELFERVAQRLVLVRLDGIESGEHLRLHLLEPRERRGRRTRRERHRVAHLRGVDLLDPGDDEADLARRQRIARHRLRREHADLLAVVGGRRRHEQDLVAAASTSLHHADQHRPRRRSCRTTNR